MKTTIAVNGACGRMGTRIIQLAHEDKSLALGAALEIAGHPQQGKDIGELAGLGKIGVPVAVRVAPEQQIDVVIDFSSPEGTDPILPICVSGASPSWSPRPATPITRSKRSRRPLIIPRCCSRRT